MKKLFFVLFVAIATTINAQSYEQTHNWDRGTLRTLEQVLDYGIELNQTGDSVYSFDIKDPDQSLEFFNWLKENCFFGKDFKNYDFSGTEYSFGYAFKFTDQWVVTCLMSENDNYEIVMEGQVKRTGAKSWGYE